MFSGALPAPAIGVAFAGSMECKTLARPDWLDCGEHQGRHFKMLHAVVELMTVEECKHVITRMAPLSRLCQTYQRKARARAHHKEILLAHGSGLIGLASVNMRDQ